MFSCYTAGFQGERARTMSLIRGVMAHGGWYIYGYAITLFHECYMRHGLHLTGVKHPTDHSMTWNYTSDMLSYYPVFLENRAWKMSLISGVVVQGWQYIYGYAIRLFMSVICGMDYWTPVRQRHELQLHNWHGQLLSLVFEEKSMNNVPHQWCSGPRMMIYVSICYFTVLWLLYKERITSDRIEPPTDHNTTSNCIKYMLNCYTAGCWKKEPEQYTSSVV